MARTVLTEELIVTDLKILNHGGIPAVTLFLNMSKQLHEEGGEGALRDWITIAAPALPEQERNDVLVMLMCSHLVLDRQTQAQTGAGASASTHH